MNYRIALCGALASLTLAACSDSKPQTTELACADPAIAQSLHNQLQQAVTQTARQFAQTDSRQFIDADKIIAAASQLGVSLNDAKTDTSGGKSLCQAQLNVAVPPALWQQAEANTAILYPQQQLRPILQAQLAGSAIQINDSTFSQPLRYLPASANSASATGNSLQIEAPGLAQLSYLISNALLPYGVKDTLIINGKAYSRAEALNIINNPNLSAPAALSPEAAIASAILNASNLPPEQTAQSAETALLATELQQQQSQNRQANNTINELWRNMDDMVRNELQSEQKQWVSKKISQCEGAATKGGSSQEAESLRLQCDTALTNERIGYLRGFSVP